MKQVPYEMNRGSSCALCCYVMAARFLLPDQDISFEQMARVADYHKGYVVWGGAVWLWMMERGIHICDFDVIDYDAVTRNGVDGLRESTTAQDFEFYYKNTYDLAKSMREMTEVYRHPFFQYRHGRVGWDDVEREFRKPGICDVTLDMGLVDAGRSGLHRVILLDIADDNVAFHDPNRTGDGAERHVEKKVFRQAMESLGDAELCRYYL